MAFAIRNLSVLAYAQGFTLWHYNARDDLLEDVAAPGYFADAEDMIAAGDMVAISAALGGRISFVGRSGPSRIPVLQPLS